MRDCFEKFGVIERKIFLFLVMVYYYGGNFFLANEFLNLLKVFRREVVLLELVFLELIMEFFLEEDDKWRFRYDFIVVEMFR